MSDLEQQLSATLADVAAEAPTAAGLAAAARRRHRLRRQRRLAGGGVLAVLVVVAAGVTIAQRGGDDRVAKDPANGAQGWQTISSGDARASVPPDWTAHTCEPGTPVWAPPGASACAGGEGVRFGDPHPGFRDSGPGEVLRDERGGVSHWRGYVAAGASVLSVDTTDQNLTRRILATARVEGQRRVIAEQWVSFDRFGMTYSVPVWWGVGEKGDRSAYSVCLVERGAPTAEPSPDLFVLSGDLGSRGIFVISAPTEAVAQLVMATFEIYNASPGECTPEDFALGLLPPEGGAPDPVEEVEEVP